MPDVPIPPTPEPTKAQQLAAELRAAKNDSERLFRYALTSDARGRVRRPLLFVCTAACIALGGAGFMPATIVALIALMILALTDSVVEL